MAKKTMSELAFVPCYDHQRRTCIQVERRNGSVKFIPLDVSGGLKVRTMPASEFDRRYQPMVNYPAEKACQLYLGYSQNIGATKEALEYLGKVINMSKQEFEMAIKKQQAAIKTVDLSPTKPVAALAPTAKAGKKQTAAKTVDSNLAKPVAAKAPAAKAGKKRPSAAQMFQDLIMQGELTDDQIFEKVQAEFGLDEKKRGYVKWYRNYLRKQGKNPPEPKVVK